MILLLSTESAIAVVTYVVIAVVTYVVIAVVTYVVIYVVIAVVFVDVGTFDWCHRSYNHHYHW